MRYRKGWLFTSVFLVVIVLLAALHPLYLKALGNYLVVSDPLSKADAILVLDGDYPRDERLLYAVQLWQSGYAPRIILSAKMGSWMSYADYPSWRHAMMLNIPQDVLLIAGHNADSTKEEAQKVLPFIKQHDFGKIIIVTSSYHTRRAAKVFKKVWAGSGVDFLVAAAKSADFHPDEWWHHRADSRTFFYELTKTIWYDVME